MRTRQRRTMSLEVNPEQREALESLLDALPSEAGATDTPSVSPLRGLFYHPNPGCQGMALVLSAGYDAVGGRNDVAVQKLDRAVRVFTLVSDDAEGRKHLEGLKARLDGDVTGFLSAIRTDVAPFLKTKMVVEAPPAPKGVVMPRPIEAGEELPEEKLSAPRPKRAPRSRRPEPKAEAAPAPEPEAAVEEAPEAPVEVQSDSVGPTEAEAAAAAAAALAAMEAPYEEVVEDDAPPRFDPDSVPAEDGRRRRRRSRGKPEGFERLRPDQVAARDQAAEPKSEPKAAPIEAPVRSEAAEASEASEASEPTSADAQPISVTRSGDVSEVAEAGLEALKLALRRAREAGWTGHLNVEVNVSAGDAPDGDGDSDNGRRRRRRRRRRGGGGRSAE